MTGQNKHETPPNDRTNTADKNITLSNANTSTQVYGSQVDMYTLEKNIVNKLRNEVDSVMTTVETRVHDPVLSAIENLVILRVELAIKLLFASSGRGVDRVVLDPDQRVFSQYIESLHLTASIRINSHTDRNRNDETRGNFTVKGGDLLVNERNIDRQTHTHHNYARIEAAKKPDFFPSLGGRIAACTGKFCL